MAKLYCYEQGSCRGDPFGSKVSFEVNQLVEWLQPTIGMDENQLDEHHDTISHGMKYEQGNALYALMRGSVYSNEGYDLKSIITKIKNGTRFSMEDEESDRGFGSSPSQAKIAFAEIHDDEDDEEW